MEQLYNLILVNRIVKLESLGKIQIYLVAPKRVQRGRVGDSVIRIRTIPWILSLLKYFVKLIDLVRTL